MDKVRCTGQNLQVTKWCPNSFYTKATSNISKLCGNKKLSDQTIQANEPTNTRYVGCPSAGGGRAVAELPVDLLLGPEAGRHFSANIQPKTTEQVRTNQAISFNQPLQTAKLPTRRRLDDQARFEPGLFSSVDLPTTSQVFKAHLQPKTTADDLPTLRPCLSAQNVRLSHQLDSGVFKGPGHPMCGLPGRFYGSKSIRTGATRQHIVHGEFDAIPRLEHQFRQVCAGSDTVPRISGHYLGYKTQRKVPVGTKVLNATQSTTDADVERQLVPKTVSITNGETQLRQLCHTSWPAALPYNTILQQTIAETTPISQGEHSTTSSHRNAMVDGGYRPINADTPQEHRSPTDNRCFGYRLGSADWRRQNSRYLDTTTGLMAREQERDVRGLRCNKSGRKPTQGCSDSIANGQSDRGVVHKKRRRNKVKETAPADTATTGASRSAEHFPNSSILSRQIQFSSRCTVPGENVPRVAPVTTSHDKNLPEVRNTGYRSVCLENRTCRCKVRDNGPAGSPRTETQCVLPSVGLQTCLGFPAPELNPPSSNSTQSCEGQIHSNSSEMEKSILESRSSASSATGTLSDSRLTAEPHRHENGNTPTGSAGPVSGGMADFGWKELVSDWTEQEQQLLMSSWRPSTINTYKPAWTRWRRWCGDHTINFKNPSADQVARYLAHLHCDEGLAYKTILVHKSVISTFTNINSNTDLSSNFFVKHMLKAISVAKNKPVKPPIWNPKTLINYINCNIINENSLYQVSRLTSTLLLLASGRRVHDLTLLTIDTDNLVDEGNAIVLWPKFGSKTDNVNYRQSGWRLREHPLKNLNIIYWIRKIIILSQPRRQDSNLKDLFITARGEPKPASRTVLGGWVKSLLRDAGIEAPPGSVRSAVASLNWLEKFPIDKILETGNWKQEHTFRKYYQKEIIVETAERNGNDSISLSNYFQPVR